MPRRLLSLCLALTGLMVLVSAGPATAATKAPSITKVSPMRLEVGDKITIRGKNFKSRRTANTVFFRGVGGRQALAKPTNASRTKLVLKVPSGVARILRTSATRIKLRVLAGKFSKYTSPRLSPVVVPEPGSGDGGGGGGDGGSGGGGSDGGGSGGTGGDSFTPAPGPAPPVCPSADGGADDDNDLLSNSLEALIGTNPCAVDTEGDGVEDGYEYKSAVDLNDDEYQAPNTSLPSPSSRPYPNPLNGDANVDHDGDSLTLEQEQAYWKFTVANGATRTLSPLTYSAGEQYSVLTRRPDGRRVPALAATGYAKQSDFLSWAGASGYRSVMLIPHGNVWYDHDSRESTQLLDFNRDGAESAGVPGGGAYRRTEVTYYDFERNGWLSDSERDEDADGLTNFDEQHGRMQPSYWAACYAEVAYSVLYAGTDPLNGDSDDDGVRDGADDQDHDDLPNVMEMSRIAASGLDDTAGSSCAGRTGLPTDVHHPDAYGRVNPFNPCLPEYSRTCTMHPGFGGNGAPFDGKPNWYSLN